MTKAQSAFSLNSHFENKEPVVRSTYEQLIKKVRQFGPVVEEPKKTSIHLVNVTAFAGVATRKNSITLTIKSDRNLPGPRILKSEQVSARRFHHEVKLTSPADVDAELLTWLRDGYALSG